VTVHIDDGADGVYVRAGTYLLWLARGRPYALLTDADGEPWAELFLASSLHTSERSDDTLRLHRPRIETAPSAWDRAPRVRIVVGSDGSGWDRKETVLECADDELRVCVAVEGHGRLTDVHLLGGYYSGDRAHGSGFHQSGASFSAVSNPEPWGSERRRLPASESTVLDVLGTSMPGKEHWLFTPPPLCLATTRQPPEADPAGEAGGPWMTIGVAAEPGQQTFTALHYDAVEGAFSLRLAYEGHTRVVGRFETPTVTFRFDAADLYAGIATHADAIRRRGWAPPADRRAHPRWWSEPIFCGWGSQCLLSGRRGGSPQDHATAETYDGFLGALAERGLHPGTVVLDDKWQFEYGSWRADERKWPDLRAWIADRHDVGQRVLLWWKAWDPEGVDRALCVRDAAGVPAGVDPTHPGYEAHLRDSVQHMLSDDGYGADGFKIDFTARTPSGPTLSRHGDAWGLELLHRLLWILHDEAKRVRPDALVMTHTPHPAFADVTDMIRLNDVNTRAPVVEQMTHRARVARAACPQLLIDTDNWPMPDPDAFRAYVRVQPDLGVPSLYYATHLDDSPPGGAKGLGHVDHDAFLRARARDGAEVPAPHPGQGVPMTEHDDDLVRASWARAREKADTDG
jgi:hypothetical protein